MRKRVEIVIIDKNFNQNNARCFDLLSECSNFAAESFQNVTQTSKLKGKKYEKD